MAAAQAAEKDGDEWVLTYFLWEIYTSIPAWNEMAHLVMNLKESQWKLRQQHDQNFPMEGKPF